MKNLKSDLSDLSDLKTTHLSFLIMILINLICYYAKAFILMSTWMKGQNLIKHNYLKNKNFTPT